MVAQKLLDRLWVKQIVYEGAFVPEQLRHFAVHRGAKPSVHHINSKAAFLPFDNASGQIALANLAVEPFPSATPNF